MPPLEEMQRAVAAAIVGNRPERAAGLVAEDAPGAARRLAIHANHYRVTLTEALAATFPVVRRRLGDALFRVAARRFIGEEPPREPRLFAYGAGFADFLARMPEASSLVYLADVARLEWALNRAYFAPDASGLDAAALGMLQADALVGMRFPLHPSCTLLRSAYPIDAIWRAHRDGSGVDASIDLGAGGVRLLVHRAGDDAGWLALGRAAFALVAALAAGRTLRAAGEAARASGEPLDATALFAALIDGGVLLPPLPEA